MAALVLYMTNALLSSAWQELSESSPGADALASPGVGWGGGHLTQHFYRLKAGQIRPTSEPSIPQPVDGIINVANLDCFRTTNPYTGYFDAGDWTVDRKVAAASGGSTTPDTHHFMLCKSPNVDGSFPTTLSALQTKGITLPIAPTPVLDSHIITLGQIALNNEYLFLQFCRFPTSSFVIEQFWVGATATKITTPNFTAGAPPATLDKGFMLSGMTGGGEVNAY